MDLFKYPVCESSSEIRLVPLDIFFFMRKFCSLDYELCKFILNIICSLYVTGNIVLNFDGFSF